MSFVKTNTTVYFYCETIGSGVYLEKVTVVHLVKNFQSFYRTRMFVTVFKTAFRSLILARLIHSILLPYDPL
jgi:hypothetical protein